MDRNKIEKKAVRTVEDYIDACPRLESYFPSNDKYPIWDGDIHIYNDEERHGVENFQDRIPVQIKGTTQMDGDAYRIERKYLKAYQADGGCVFFLVQEGAGTNRILYAMLSLKDIDDLLKRSTKTIAIPLQPVPSDLKMFQAELTAFAKQRNKIPTEASSPTEIASLVKGFKNLEQHLDGIESREARFELEETIQAIRRLKNDGTTGWRDKFVYFSRKAIDLAKQHIQARELTGLQFKLGKYLHEQKLYHYVEGYYLQALEAYREQAKTFLSGEANVATTLNNLALLHSTLNRPADAESEYNEALKIYRSLAEVNPDAYLADVAMTLNNLANLHSALNRPAVAEAEYNEALEIYRSQAKVNPDAYLNYVATTLNNLAVLRYNLNRPADAESEYHEALEIYRSLAKVNPDAYLADVAGTLNNLANLHDDLNRPADAEAEYNEALEIYRSQAKVNPDAYLNYVATTLNNLAVLHYNLNRPADAESEYHEALEIYRSLAKVNPDAYLSYVATTLNNLALLHNALNRPDDAEAEYNEALEIRRKLAKVNPDAYLADVATTLNNLANLHDELNRPAVAEAEYNEALEIRRKLAKVNPDAYLADVAQTLNNLAALHDDLNRPADAEAEYNEALEIRRKLAKVNPDAYLSYVAGTLYNLALLLMKDEQRRGEAKQACQEALDLYKVMAGKVPQRWSQDVEKAQKLLDDINSL